MKDYCCQIQSVSGRILETFYEDFFEAMKEATTADRKHALEIRIFHYPNMEDPICVMKKTV